jgi:peptide-methionine (S)-S-oxide reductase
MSTTRSRFHLFIFAGALLLLGARAMPHERGAASTPQVAVFAGGCFWGIEAVFEHVKGVIDVVSGYSGGSVANPTYEDVGSGDTGHAESVRVTFDPAKVSYEQLLEVFFTVAHDPTQLNRQGPDVGTQYRSIVFYADAAQQRAANDYIARLTKSGRFRRPIVTEVVPFRAFYMAEAYHQDYLAHHPDEPYIVYNDLPKLTELRRQRPDLYVGR